MMIKKITSPLDIVCHELHRLNNDADRLQMLITLKSHLNNLQLTPNTLHHFFSIFNHEQYRLQAIHQLLISIHKFITPDSLRILFELFTISEYRLNLIDILKNCEPLKTNKEVNEILLDEYRRYFHLNKTKSEQNIKSIEKQKDEEINTDKPPTSKVLSSTSGVFEKAKQFVCRVFGGGSSTREDEPSNKRLFTEVNSLTDINERKKLHTVGGDIQLLTDYNDAQFQPTSFPVSTSRSYSSMIIQSPPPSPIIPQLNTNLNENILSELNTTIQKRLLEEYQEQPIVRQSSMSFHVDESSSTSLPVQSMMVTQIHSILDNIDSVLDKIEAQTNSAIRRPAFNENYPVIETANVLQLDMNIPEEISSVQQSADQITQTAINIVERHFYMNDGSGDTTPALIDLLDILEESSSMLSSDNSDELIDDLIDQ